jgi:hypothetical protein
MSDLRTQLDRVAARAQPGTDAFERLAHRRRRRHRNRRIAAGIVALAVATGGALVAHMAFTGHRESQTVRRLSNGAVLDPELAFNVAPGVGVPLGHPVTLHASVPQGTVVDAGVILRACGTQAVIAAHRVPGDGNISFQVAGPGCEGIVGYPVHGWLVAFVPPKQVVSGLYTLTPRILLDWHRTGRLPHLTIVPEQFVEAKSGAHAEPYPRGAFSWCPRVQGALPFGRNAATDAAAVATRFAKAYLRHDRSAQASLEDPSVRSNINLYPAVVLPPVHVQFSERALTPGNMERPQVRFGCGEKVAKRTWAVAMNAGNPSAITLYLVRRTSGWKVWGTSA